MTSVPRLACLALLVVACGAPDSRVPSLDGPLVLDVRYPASNTPVPAVDSIAIWGTVGTGRATLHVNGAPVAIERNGTFADFLPVLAGDAPELRLVARRNDDSVVRIITLRRGALAARDSGSAPAAEGNVRAWTRWVMMRRLPSDTADSATQWRPIYSRRRPGGEIAVPLAQGMRLAADARTDRSIRLRLAPDTRVWIPALDADSSAAPRPALLTAGAPIVLPDSSALVISIALPYRLPTSVELSGDRLLWTVYGATWRQRPSPLPGDGGAVRRIVPRDSARERLVVDLGLATMPLGWRTDWRDGALRLTVRRAPRPSPSLAGLVIALDPGHPPDGTIGPSGLMEDSVTLAVAQVAAAKLRALGAEVLLTRPDRAPVSLEARAVVAERSRAHLFISLHLNAPGPGRPPAAVFGAQTYWTNPNGRTLARLLLAEVARSMGHPAIGTYRGDFAVLRPAWATAALVEGSGIVIPEREAFLRTSAGVNAYAQGIVNGVRRWQRAANARALPLMRER